MMRIVMPRGDIRDVRFTVYDSTGRIVSPVNFDEIYVTVKSKLDKANFLFQKKLSDGTITKEGTGIYQFSIRPEDTNSLSYGAYAFDIELLYGDSIKQTTVGSLELTPEVTFAVNE